MIRVDHEILNTLKEVGYDFIGYETDLLKIKAINDKDKTCFVIDYYMLQFEKKQKKKKLETNY